MDALQTLLAAHAARYPLWQPADAYKLLHQAVLGAGHAVQDADAALRRLSEEFDTLGELDAEPLIDPLCGALLRVHLRAYRAQGYSTAALAQAFVASARRPVADDSRLRQVLPQLEQRWPDARTLWVELLAAELPAIGHSAAYRHAYRPAYRVLHRDDLPAELRAR